MRKLKHKGVNLLKVIPKWHVQDLNLSGLVPESMLFMPIGQPGPRGSRAGKVVWKVLGTCVIISDRAE